MAKDLHEEPFDETTISKLEIFEDYAQEWIPAFVMRKVPLICIFDFFAGTGYDISGVSGSPIRILDKIKEQLGNIFKNKVKVRVFFNEFEPKREQRKFPILRKACEEYLEKNPAVRRAIEINYYNEDCETLFPKLLPTIIEYPSLVYLDQNGIKFLSDKYLLELEKTKQTDFLYFLSSSYFWRFGDTPEIRKHVQIDMEAAKKNPYEHIHRTIISQLRQKLPANSKLKLYPFSLKKGTNIYGIIFGATHPRAVDKFLNLAWKRNTENGQADFDIEGESRKAKADLFTPRQLTKIEEFQQNVRNKVLSKEITNNEQLFNYVMQEGHIGKHAADCLKEMKKKGEIDYDGAQPLVTYESVYKKGRKLDYKVKK